MTWLPWLSMCRLASLGVKHPLPAKINLAQSLYVSVSFDWPSLQSAHNHEIITATPSKGFSNAFPPNTLRNQKYSIVTFFPLVFYEQFKFFFNLYFLLVALSQFIPALKIGEFSRFECPGSR